MSVNVNYHPYFNGRDNITLLVFTHIIKILSRKHLFFIFFIFFTLGEVADLQATAQALQHNHDQHNNTITGLSIYAALLTAVFIAVLFRLCHYYKRATQKAHQDTNNSPLLYNPMQQKNNTYVDVDNPGVDNNVNKLDDGSEEALVPSPPDPVIRENKIIEDYNELENLAVDLAAEGS